MSGAESNDATASLGSTFLFIGTSTVDAAVSKLKAYGIRYEHKLLESAPPNWYKIIEILGDPTLKGTIAKFTVPNINRTADPRYRDVTKELLQKLGAQRHRVLIYEGILLGEPSDFPPAKHRHMLTYGEAGIEGHDPFEVIPGSEYPSTTPSADAQYFVDPSPETLKMILAEFDSAGVEVLPYRTNAQFSLLAAEFIDDAKSNLLFRI